MTYANPTTPKELKLEKTSEFIFFVILSSEWLTF